MTRKQLEFRCLPQYSKRGHCKATLSGTVGVKNSAMYLRFSWGSKLLKLRLGTVVLDCRRCMHLRRIKHMPLRRKSRKSWKGTSFETSSAERYKLSSAEVYELKYYGVYLPMVCNCRNPKTQTSAPGLSTNGFSNSEFGSTTNFRFSGVCLECSFASPSVPDFLPLLFCLRGLWRKLCNCSFNSFIVSS